MYTYELTATGFKIFFDSRLVVDQINNPKTGKPFEEQEAKITAEALVKDLTTFLIKGKENTSQF